MSGPGRDGFLPGGGPPGAVPTGQEWPAENTSTPAHHVPPPSGQEWPAEGGHGSHHGPPPGRHDRPLGALFGPLAGAVGLSALLGLGTYALADSGLSCATDNAIALNLAVSPDIAPAVRDVAEGFNEERHHIDGRCVRAVVRPVDSSAAATVLSGQGSPRPGDPKPDIWVPDSTTWVTRVRSSEKGATAVSLTPASVAQSPIVIATPRSLAGRLNSQGRGQPTWIDLMRAAGTPAPVVAGRKGTPAPDPVRVQLIDPTRSATGLGALIVTRHLLERDPDARSVFTGIVRGLQGNATANLRMLFDSLGGDAGGRVPAVITSEQAVWKLNQDGPQPIATAVYPAEGTLNLDYPFTLATADPVKLRAAELLEDALGTPSTRTIVTTYGFRAADGSAGNALSARLGVNPSASRMLPVPNAVDIEQTLQAWTKLTLASRMLILMDVSSPMAKPVPGTGLTRMQVMTQIAQRGLPLLRADTDLGLWTFATNLDGPRDYHEEVPVGPLDGRVGALPRRRAAHGALGRLRPKAATQNALYDAVLFGVQEMRRSYQPDMYNSVVVLTGSRNTEQGAIPLQRLVTHLKDSFDPNRPVMVILVGFGTDIDRAAMEKIAAATNGTSYVARRPQQIENILLDTIARRVCAPDCDTN